MGKNECSFDDGQPKLARQGDGVHLSVYGSDKLAAAVFEVIDEEMERGR